MISLTGAIFITICFKTISVFANGGCLTYTLRGSCCAGSCWPKYNWYKCSAMPDNAEVHCSDTSKLPDVIFGQPLGMMNGLISGSQLVVPDDHTAAENARKLWGSGAGWQPAASYFASAIASRCDAFSRLKSAIPIGILQAAPIFFEIDFLRPKRLFYVIVGHGKRSSYDRRFAITYRDVNGKMINYGGEDRDYAKVFECDRIVRSHRLDCRIKLTPFRARSIRLIATDYNRSLKDKIFLEIGGFDYLEADHRWSFDTIKVSGGSYFPDAAGSLHLYKKMPVSANYTGPDAGIFNSSDEASANVPSASSSCLADQTNCKDGFSIAFWFKVGSWNFSIAAMGNEVPNANHIGFKVLYDRSKILNVDIILEKQHHSIAHRIATHGWTHFVITWSKFSVMKLYENGALVANGSNEAGSFTPRNMGLLTIASGTANNETKLHDLRLWSYWLARYDVLNVFSPGPKNCLEALAMYGRKTSVYSIYTYRGWFPLKCIPVANGSMFHFFPDVPVYNVSGPWINSQFTAWFRYDHDNWFMKHMLKSASYCSQTVYYECLQTPISENTNFRDISNNNWNPGCVGGKCNCDDTAIIAVQKDTELFLGENRLPLQKVTTANVNSITQYQTIELSPVTCFTDMRVYSSCKDALTKNSMRVGTYIIATAKKNIPVRCGLLNSEVKTVIRHADSGVAIRVKGYERTGSYARKIEYFEDFESIVSVVNSSERCQQLVTYACFGTLISGSSWFTGPDGQKIQSSCDCYGDNSCGSSSRKCRCDANDNVNREDSILFSKKSDLPLTSFTASDTGGSQERIDITTGDLECFGDGNAGVNPSRDCSQRLDDGTCFSSSNEGLCKDEMDYNGCCKFPFTYRGVTYSNCTSRDSKVPWCSLTSAYTGKWRYCISQLPKADIDFSVSTMEDTGDWKVGSDCSEESSSGPCYDMTLSSKPSDKMTSALIEFRMERLEFKTYSKYTHLCPNNVFQPSIAVTLAAVAFRLNDFSRPQSFKKAVFCLRHNADYTVEAIIHIYAIVPLENLDGMYVRKCKFASFRAGMHFGPVVWQLGPLVKDKTYCTPDLKRIIAPILQSKDPNVARNRLLLVFEFQEFLKGTHFPDLSTSLHNFLQISYMKKEPGNYLFADSLDARKPGLPLIYNTRHFPPTKKCLQFWYYMEAVGNSLLTVNLYQSGYAAREILRIKGNQGSKWRRATIPIENYLNNLGSLIKVSFVAIRGPTISRSIAIDDISFLNEICVLQPSQSYQQPGNLPKAEMLLPLDSGHYDNASRTASVKHIPIPVHHAPRSTEDKFGYPLFTAYFDSNTTGNIRAQYDEKRISADFSICLQVKPIFITQMFIFYFKQPQGFSISMESDGDLTIGFNTTERGKITLKMGLPVFVEENKWKFICFVFEHHLGVLKLFVDGQLTKETTVGFVTPDFSIETAAVGLLHRQQFDTASRVFISCVQFYASAIDDDLISVLDLCPNRHMKDVCKANCIATSLCHQFTARCICPSHTNRFVKDDCSNALISTVYNGSMEYISFDDRNHYPGKIFRSLSELLNRTREYRSYFKDFKYAYVSGPVNSALCVMQAKAIKRPITAPSCFSTGPCESGSTVAFWIYVPAIHHWDAIGNVTLLTYGKISVIYGIVNDMRNGTTKPIPSLMFQMTGSKTCLWVSIIHGSMITDAWSHLTITIDSSDLLNVFYNGNLNYVKKYQCLDPEGPNSDFATGSLNFTCFDEVVVWDRMLNRSETEKTYKAIVYGGSQASQKQIRFKKLAAREPNDLFAIDQSDIAYMYLNASWAPLSSNRIRDVSAGISGVLSVLQNNTLNRRKGISPDNPVGLSWEMMPTNVALKGAVVDLISANFGLAYAKSLYQWHCTDTSVNNAIKNLLPLKMSDGSLTNLVQLSCMINLCWGIPGNYYPVQIDSIADCKLNQHAPVSREREFIQLGTTFFKYFPFGIEKYNKTLMEGRPLQSSKWHPVKKGVDKNDLFVDVAGLNGLPVGVKANGDVELVSQDSEPFLIRLNLENKLCWRRDGDRIKLADNVCIDLFVHTEDRCLLHLQTRKLLQLQNNGIKLIDECAKENRVQLDKDGLIKLLYDNNTCLSSGTSSNHDIKLVSYDSGSCLYFTFETVSPIKKVCSHNLIWSGTDIGDADVKVDIFAIFHLRYPRWTDDLSETGPEFAFFCGKVRQELLQQFAGNANYRRFECKSIEKEECSLDLAKNCHFKIGARLFFGHVDEGTRMILFSRKFNGQMTDCSGTSCSLSVSRNAFGVDFTPQRVDIINTTSKSVTLKSHPSWKSTHSAIVGYNVSVAGYSKQQQNARTIYIMERRKVGNLFKIENLPPYFNFTSNVQQLFVQGVGNPTKVEFATKQAAPSEAPGITIESSERNKITVNIGKIAEFSWNGDPIGYRIYYQSLLKIDTLPDLKDLQGVEETHAQHVNFTFADNDLSLPLDIPGLEVFTNYSIIIGAYTAIGVGVLSQVFQRTNQGEPEVYTPDFNVTVVNSTHLNACWSPFTTDIELLNGWFLSNYTVKYEEQSDPPVMVPLHNTVVLMPNETSFLIGPLKAAREYNISISGNVEARPGIFFSLCIRTDQDVPDEPPIISNVTGISSSVLNYTTGCINLTSENGEVLYYNISATLLMTNETTHHKADITKGNCVGGFDCFAKNSSKCPDSSSRLRASGVFDALRASYLVARNCSRNRTQLLRTSYIIQYSIDNLRYWTNYSIRSSACTVKGCGPFNEPVFVRTDEHSPTCSPNITYLQNTSSTSMVVAWNEIPISCAHGVVLYYNLFFSPKSEITHEECFNNSSCWPKYDPAASNSTKFYVSSTDPTLEVNGLKKYKEYCVFLQAVNIKGRGPVSQKHCNFTAEDEPDGPPAAFSVSANSATSVEIYLSVPLPDIINGIINGYQVFYYEVNEAREMLGNLRTVDIETSGQNSTVGLINGLRGYRWYNLTARAYTSVGAGQNSTFRTIRTLEDVPSAPPRNLSVANVTANGIAALFQQTESFHLNGIFIKFKIRLIENRNDGLEALYSFFAAGSNNSVEQQAAHNASAAIPVLSRKRRGSLGAVQSALNGANEAAAAIQNTTKSLLDTANGVRNSLSNLTNPLLNSLQQEANLKDRAIASVNITSLKANMISQVDFDVQAENFAVIISGLLPYTHYNISVSTCTIVGCGPNINGSIRTAQSTPSGSPEPYPYADKTERSLLVTWKELPIMQTNGIISGYLVKWMKNCEYLRLMNLATSVDCLRVPAENTQIFNSTEIAGEIRNATISGLVPFTWYRCEICAKTVTGYGPCSNVTYRTGESVPCEAPNMTRSFEVTGKSFQVEWEDIELPCQNGIILGYITYYQLTSLVNYTSPGGVQFDSQRSIQQPPPNFMLIDNLQLRSNYSFKIAGYTSKGPGVNSSLYYAITGEFKHGNWTVWSQWGFCSHSCGGGIRIRKRRCDNPAPYNGGDDCKGWNNETEVCNTKHCSGPAIGSEGQNCDQACSGFDLFCNPKMNLEDSTRTYKKLGLKCKDSTSNAVYSKGFHPSFVKINGNCEGYKSLPAAVNCSIKPPEDKQTIRLCNCMSPDDCGCEEWAEWSICSKPKCGGGTMKRTRSCDILSFCPSGQGSQTLDCNMTPCPIDGNWGEWSETTSCNKTCGYGFRHRYRKCNNPAHAYGGRNCHGQSVDVIPGCNVHKCPVHGQWGQWGEWRECSKPCGGGDSIRKRYCDSPEPRYLGNDCEGTDTDTTPCNPHACEGVEILFTVKLVDFTWEYQLVYSGHPKTMELAETTRENVKAVYNHSSIVNLVNVINFVQGSVIANFSIFYVEVSQGQVLLLQDYISSTGKMFNLSTVVQEVKPIKVVAEPPSNVTAMSYTERTMTLTWNPPKDYQMIVNISGYYVFYREYDSTVGQWNVAGVPGLNTTSFLLRDLKPYIKYRFRMTLAVRTGNGPASEEVVNSTIEGVPKIPPTKFSAEPFSASKVYLQWTGITDSEFNGRPLGYAVRYKQYFAAAYKEITVSKTIWDATILDLKAYTLYDFEVLAYSGAGYGPPVSAVIKTPEGSPSVSPPSFAVQNGVSTSSLIATWQRIPHELVNGVLLGYKLKYTLTHISDQVYVGAPITKEIVLDKFTFWYKITGLQSYTTYDISVSGFTAAGEGPYSKPVVGKTCKCPADVFLNWYPNPPYVVKEPGLQMSGFLFGLVEDMIKTSCGKCNGVASNIHRFRSLLGTSPVKKNELGVKKAIGDEYHVSFPIFGSASLSRYMEKHVFILFIKSSGSATVVKHKIDYSAKTLNAFKSIANVWPMYVLVIFLTSLAGILIWLMEQNDNEEFAKGKYIHGVFQGFWWAFISMTTVGYGDITPRTFKGRCVAIVWTLAGLILTGILTGALTSSVTSMTMPPAITLYGTECAAVNNSFEYNLAVRRNGKVNTKRHYQTFEEVLDAVKNEEVKVGLLDGFTVASLTTKLVSKGLKVVQVIDANSGYGVVLSHELVRLESDFRSFVASQQDQISSFTSNMTEKLHMAKSDVEEVVPLLFDPSTKIFWDMIVVECILVAVCSVLGIAYSFFRSKKGKRKVIPANEARLQQMALLDESVADFEETLNNKLESLSKKHISESFELLRLKSSYKRLRKREDKKGIQILSPEQTEETEI